MPPDVLSTENPDLALLPGMTAIVRVVVDEAKDVLKVPNAALRFEPPRAASTTTAAAGEVPAAGRGAVVWILGDDDALVPVQVALGGSNESVTGLVDGPLRAGQEVIIGTATPPQGHSWFGFGWRL